MTALTSIWPLFVLELTTPRLVLRPISDAAIPAAVAAAASGVHEPGRKPFSTPGTELPADNLGPDMAEWTVCIAGALTHTEFTDALTAAGFTDIEIRPTHRVHAHAQAAIIRATH